MSAMDADPGPTPANSAASSSPGSLSRPLDAVLAKGRFHTVEYRIRTCKLDTEGLPSLFENGIGFVPHIFIETSNPLNQKCQTKFSGYIQGAGQIRG